MARDGKVAQIEKWSHDQGVNYMVAKDADESETSTTPQDQAGLSIAVHDGDYYQFDFTLLIRSSDAADGPKVSLTFPSVTTFGARVQMQNATTDTVGAITASGGTVSVPSVLANNTTYVCRIAGAIAPSADGTLQVQVGSVNGTGTITTKEGSFGVINEIDP